MYAPFARIVVFGICLAICSGNPALAADYPTDSFPSPIQPAVQPESSQPQPTDDRFGSGAADLSPAAFQSPEVFQRPDPDSDASPSAGPTPTVPDNRLNPTRPAPGDHARPDNELRQPHSQPESDHQFNAQPAEASIAPERFYPGEIDARPLSESNLGDKPRDAFPVMPASRTALEDTPSAQQKPDPVARPLDAPPRTLPLTAGSDKSLDSKAKLPPKPTAAKSGMNSVTTVLGSLGIAIGLFLVLAWVMRRGGPKANRALSSDVVEVLGRSPLVGRQQMQLIRFGNKLVLVSVSPGNVDTISEITDPVEIDRIAGICQQGSPFSATSSFRQALSGHGGRSSDATRETSSETAPAQNFSSLFRRPKNTPSSEAYDA